MSNFEIQEDEVILYEGNVTSDNYEGPLFLTLTSQNIVIEKYSEKEREFLDCFSLKSVKFYNEKPQFNHKGNLVKIQTTKANISLTFVGKLGIIEAHKFTTKAIDATTHTTLTKRCINKVKCAIDIVDETLEIDSRAAVRNVLGKGIKGVIIGGIKNKKN